MTAVLILGVIVAAAGVGLLHYFGTVADEQRVEAERLQLWEQDLTLLDAQLVERAQRLQLEQRSGIERRGR